MLKALLAQRLRNFEETWNYDAAHMRDLLAASLWTALKFSVIPALPARKDVPAAALAAAEVFGTLSEDCGPCTQLSVDMAAKRGVPADVLRAILAGDADDMGEDAGLAYRFVKAVVERRLDDLDVLRDDVVRRWDHRGLVALSLALTTARTYPVLKYALGHGHTCTRVTVNGLPAALSRPEAMAG